MLSGRPRASDTAGRASPTFGRSGNSFFAKIFVFLAFFVEGAVAVVGDECYPTSIGCCECLCDGSSVDPPEFVTAYHSTASDAESWCNNDGYGYGLSACKDMDGLSLVFKSECGVGTVSLRWVPASTSCTTSQYLKDGACVSCPNTSSSCPASPCPPPPPPSTSTGGNATFCTCPENYYASVDILSNDWTCQECPVGYSFIKNGSVIPTASGTSDTCDCKAGYYLDNTGLNCNMCAPGTTSAGGRVTECSAIPNSDARATGGTTITTVGDYVIHTFTSSGTFAVTDSSLTEVDVLVVGGGGGGGGEVGGGGGGGAVLYSVNKTLSSSSITVTVGNGGDGLGYPIVYDGGASDFDGLVANGGKAGNNGADGGASGSGNAGGSGYAKFPRWSGGGGGAGGPGEAGQEWPYEGGVGGPGVESAISGTSSYYGGGGGGSCEVGCSGPGNGGLGGGGQGSMDGGFSAAANTGGGGGGGGYNSNAGSNGGSGVVVVRYKKKATASRRARRVSTEGRVVRGMCDGDDQHRRGTRQKAASSSSGSNSSDGSRRHRRQHHHLRRLRHPQFHLHRHVRRHGFLSDRSGCSGRGRRRRGRL